MGKDRDPHDIDRDEIPDESPETPLDEPRPPRIQDPSPEPEPQPPYVVRQGHSRPAPGRLRHPPKARINP